MLRWILAAGCVVGLSGDGFSQPALPKKQQEQLAEIVQAANLGDPVQIVVAAAPVATKSSDADFKAMNETLAAEHVPSVGELLVFARMRLDDAKLSKAVPKPTVPERLRMLAAIADMGDEALVTAGKMLADDVNLREETMRAYEERLRLIDRHHRSLYSAWLTAQYGQTLIKKIPARSREKLEGADAAAVERNSPERIAELKQSTRDLFELQLALRLERLDYGIEVLKETMGQLTKERFFAAYTTGMDGRYLQDVLKNAKTTAEFAKKADKPAGKPAKKTVEVAEDKADDEPADEADDEPNEPEKLLFTREELNDPELESSIAERLKLAEGLAGDLADKARNFFEGLDWWLRGRFGSGPEVAGLVKSEQALSNPELLFYVNMPVEIPTPLAQTDLSRIRPNHIDRRHHYIWNWEDRKLVKEAYRTRYGTKLPPRLHKPRIHLVPFDFIDWIGATDRFMNTPGEGIYYVPGTFGRGHTGEGLSAKFKSVHLPPQDPRLVYRLVGFVEYTKALEDLDQFVKDASLQELELADEIVRDNDQFIIYANLSRPLETQPNVLSERGKNERDDFARHGLPWVLGLARIELGAMLAGFTSAPDPFQLMIPPQKSPRSPEHYGAEEYLELLLDGMRTHYWSLKSDPEVWNYRKTGVPEEHLVTYTRRVTLARQFLGAAGRAATDPSNPTQLQLLGQWDEELAAVHRMLIYCLAKKQGQESFAQQQFERGKIKIGPAMRTQVNRSPLPDVMELIDPTLKFCQCR